MSTTALRSTPAAVPLTRREAGYQGYLMLRVAFTVAPIAFGLDKFFNVLTSWPHYLAPWINDLMPGSAQDFMHFVGVVEIVAGVVVAVRPRYGAPLVAAWLGGMAVVYLARQPDLDRDVALKELASFHAPDPGFAERFAREARVGGSLAHPNIVTVFEAFEHGGLPYNRDGVPAARLAAALRR